MCIRDNHARDVLTYSILAAALEKHFGSFSLVSFHFVKIMNGSNYNIKVCSEN